MQRTLLAVVLPFCLAAAPAPAAASGGGDPPSPAAFFPAHTYAYVELSPFAGTAGVKALRLAKLLEDEAIAGLVGQALQQIPPDADPQRMLERYPFHEALEDGIGVGLIGFRARTGRGTNVDPHRHWRFPEDGAVPSDLFQQSVSFQSEQLLVARIKDEDAFMVTLMRLLADLGDPENPIVPETVQLDGDVEAEAWVLPGSQTGEPVAYSVLTDGYFLVGQSEDALAEAIGRGRARRASLHNRSDFLRFAQHRAGKTTGAIMHFGLDSVIDTFRLMIPERQREEMALWGGFDYQGLQCGLGFHEGGICEWFHLAFADNARGVLMNLARLWPTTGYVERETKQGMMYAAALQFDCAALYETLRFTLDLCDVDMDAFERDVRRDLGMDLREDLLAAIGSKMGVMVVLPKHGLIPELTFTLEVRDRVRLERMLGQLVSTCESEGMRTRSFNVPGEGPKATYVGLGQDVPFKPAFVMRGNQLVVSMMPLTLKSAVRVARDTGLSMIDLMPDTRPTRGRPIMSYRFDPAPMARDGYADLLKLLDSSGRRMPFEPADLPSPEFVADCLAPFGIDCSADAYHIAIDLHSPAGIAVPLMLGGAAAVQIQQQQEAAARARARGRVSTN